MKIVSALLLAAPLVAAGGLRRQATQSTCTTHMINFDTGSNGAAIAAGAYVQNEWLAEYGFVVSAMSATGYTPNNKARMFDTSNPGTNNNNGDPDLGAPNQACNPSGPGVGGGGAPGKAGENCAPQGLVLIIQETDKVYPDDNARGGVIEFDFGASPVAEVLSVGLMDVDSRHRPVVNVNSASGDHAFKAKRLGGNSIQSLNVGVKDVTKVAVTIPTSGAISHLEVCITDPTPAPTPVPATPAPTPVPATPAPTPVPATPAPTPVPATPAPTPVPATPSPTFGGGGLA